MAGTGMALNIGERFLHDTIERGTCLRLQRFIQSACLQLRFNAGSFRKMFTQGFERDCQAKIIQNARTQIMRKPPHLLDCAIEGIGCFLDCKGRAPLPVLT